MNSDIRRAREKVVQEKYFSSHTLLGFLFVCSLFVCFVLFFVCLLFSFGRGEREAGRGKGAEER